MKQNYFMLAILATVAAIASIIVLVLSAVKSGGKTDVQAVVIAVTLMAVALWIARYVRRKRKEEEEKVVEEEVEAVDEEYEAFLDSFYDLGREDEFYSCLENYGPAENFEETQKNFEIVKAKAIAAGSKEYVWRTSRDQDVCLRCRRNNGKHFSWNDDNIRGDHPGCSPGCRCQAEPVMPLDRPKPTSANSKQKGDKLKK